MIEGRDALLSVGESSGFPSVYSHTPLWGGEDGSLCFTNSLCEGVYRSFPSCLLGVGKSYPTAFCSSRLPLSWLSGWRKRVFWGGFYFLV